MELQRRELIEFKICKDTDHEEVQKIIAENANGALFLYPSYIIQAPTLRSRNLQENLTDKLFDSPDLDETLRSTGQFSVPSVLFLGNALVWRISEIFQKGKRKTTFYAWVANAYK